MRQTTPASTQLQFQQAQFYRQRGYEVVEADAPTLHIIVVKRAKNFKSTWSRGATFEGIPYNIDG